MFRLPQKPTRRLALLILFPALLVLSYFSLARSTDGPTRSSAHTPEAAAKRPELKSASDLDHDGLPDVAELRTFNDRETFRRWFTWVAEMQFYKLSDQWNPEQRDCAGLVRFAWREALRPHDRPWFQRMGENYDPVAPDLTSNVATRLRGKLFRTAPGTYSPTDLAEGRFSDFADARRSSADCRFVFQRFVRRHDREPENFLGCRCSELPARSARQLLQLRFSLSLDRRDNVGAIDEGAAQ